MVFLCADEVVYKYGLYGGYGTTYIVAYRVDKDGVVWSRCGIFVAGKSLYIWHILYIQYSVVWYVWCGIYGVYCTHVWYIWHGVVFLWQHNRRGETESRHPPTCWPSAPSKIKAGILKYFSHFGLGIKIYQSRLFIYPIYLIMSYIGVGIVNDDSWLNQTLKDAFKMCFSIKSIQIIFTSK